MLKIKEENITKLFPQTNLHNFFSVFREVKNNFKHVKFDRKISKNSQ